MITKLKKLNIDEIILVLFPISILLRTATLNFYLIFCGLFFIYKFYQKKISYDFLKTEWVFVFSLILLITFFKSFFSIDFLGSIKGVLSLVKFILFCFFIATLNITKKNRIFIFELISYVLFFVCIDTFIQLIFGKDIFGFEIHQFGRLGGPFNDELIVGAFLTFISIPIVYLFLDIYQSKDNVSKIYYFLFIIIIYFTVFISGERMNFIILNTAYLIIFLRNFNYKKISLIFTFILISIILILNLNNDLNSKYKSFFEDLSNFNKSNHGKLLISSLEIWKNNKLLGVGLKNYRIHCKNIAENQPSKKIICSTHPHNLYFELLVEVGIIGIVLFIIFEFFLIIKIFNGYSNSTHFNKSIIYGASLVVFFYFWPLRSNGSFFSTFNGSLFWFNLGIILLFLKENFKKS